MEDKKKELRYFDKTREMYSMVKNEKPGDASADVAIIMFPFILIVDLISLPFVIYQHIKKKD